VAIVEEGSFTRAAERLAVTQPGLSHQFQALEQEAGGLLLERLLHRRAVEMAAAMAAGQADLAIGPRPEDWEGPVRLVGAEEFVVVTDVHDPVARGRSGRVLLADLAARRWVHFTLDSGLAGFLDRACAAAGFEPRVAVRTEQGMSAANYAAAGLGPTLVPAEIIPPHFGGALLRPDPPVRRPLTAYTRTSPDPIAAAFIDILATEALITPAHVRRRLGPSRGLSGVPPRSRRTVSRSGSATVRSKDRI